MTDHAPAWLFSFVDLAFLLLIAMTQVGVESNGIAMELGEIVIPRIQSDATQDLVDGDAKRWQLRVHPTTDELLPPFQLAQPGENLESTEARQAVEALREQLAGLHAQGVLKPLLAPHEDSRSQDMLDAVGILEELWPSRRRATVARLLASQ